MMFNRDHFGHLYACCPCTHMDRIRAGIPGRPNLKRVHILTSALPQVFISFRIYDLQMYITNASLFTHSCPLYLLDHKHDKILSRSPYDCFEFDPVQCRLLRVKTVDLIKQPRCVKHANLFGNNSALNRFSSWFHGLSLFFGFALYCKDIL